MARVSIREFSRNPSAMFARAEQGETIEVTKHGEVIATVVPTQRRRSRYDELVAAGVIIPAANDLTTEELDRYTRIDVPADVDPLALLLEMREDER